MKRVQELIDAVQATGASLRADPPDLVIGDPDLLSAELMGRLREYKLELLAVLDLSDSMRRLEAADIRVAIFVTEIDACLLVVDREIRTDAEANQAITDGAVIYNPADMLAYIELPLRERRMLHEFKRRFGGATEWRISAGRISNREVEK